MTALTPLWVTLSILLPTTRVSVFAVTGVTVSWGKPDPQVPTPAVASLRCAAPRSQAFRILRGG